MNRKITITLPKRATKIDSDNESDGNNNDVASLFCEDYSDLKLRQNSELKPLWVWYALLTIAKTAR
jgi:hypothetical protein